MAKYKVLGFTIGRDKEKKKVPEDRLQPFSLPDNQDAALTVEAPTVTGGAYGTYLDLEGTVKNEVELITRYREMAMNPEVELADGICLPLRVVFIEGELRGSGGRLRIRL